MELNRSKGGSPLYFQIKNIIQEQIENEEYSIGDILPSEKQLQEKYNVSRATIRQAVSELVNMGYLQTLRGIGTTVVYKKIDENTKQVISFSEEMAQHGIIMKTTYCVLSKIPADKRIANRLAVNEGDDVYELIRVRSIKDSPLVYSSTYLRAELDLPMDSNTYVDSLYSFLKEERNVQITKGQDSFEATLANDETSGFLKIPMASSVLKRTRKTFNQDNSILEYSICFYPGDRYKYTVDV